MGGISGATPLILEHHEGDSVSATQTRDVHSGSNGNTVLTICQEVTLATPREPSLSVKGGDRGAIMKTVEGYRTPLQRARERDRADRAGRAEAERRADELVTSKQIIGRDEMEYVLETWVSRKNRGRKRVRPQGWECVNSDTFGMAKSHSGGIFISGISIEYPRMLEVLGLYVYSIAGKQISVGLA